MSEYRKPTPEEIKAVEAFVQETTRGSESAAEAQSRVRWAIDNADPKGPIPAIAETMMKMAFERALNELFEEQGEQLAREGVKAAQDWLAERERVS